MDVQPSPQSAPSSPLRRAGTILGGLIAAAAAVAVLGVFVSQKLLMDWLASARPPDVEDSLAVHSRLANLPAFAPTTRERDAGERLNRHLRLDDDAHPALDPVWWTSITEEERHIKKDWLDRPEALWTEAGEPRYDDAILQELLAYDHWDVTSSGTYAAYLEAPNGPYIEQPIPWMVGLQYLGKVRLNRGLHEQDMTAALQEVRHLARLLLHAEDAVSFAIGLSLLGSERLAADRAIEAGILGADAWQPVREKDLKKARAVLFKGSALLYLPDEPAVEEFFTRPHVVGRCAMLEFGALGFVVVRDQMGTTRAPLEADFLSLRHRYERLWAASGCALKPLSSHWDPPPAADQTFNPMMQPYLRSYWVAGVLRLALQSSGP